MNKLALLLALAWASTASTSDGSQAEACDAPGRSVYLDEDDDGIIDIWDVVIDEPGLPEFVYLKSYESDTQQTAVSFHLACDDRIQILVRLTEQLGAHPKLKIVNNHGIVSGQGKWLYTDFDCDGKLDSARLRATKDPKSYVLFDNEWENVALPSATTAVRAEGERLEYAWGEKKWVRAGKRDNLSGEKTPPIELNLGSIQPEEVLCGTHTDTQQESQLTIYEIGGDDNAGVRVTTNVTAGKKTLNVQLGPQDKPYIRAVIGVSETTGESLMHSLALRPSPGSEQYFLYADEDADGLFDSLSVRHGDTPGATYILNPDRQ